MIDLAQDQLPGSGDVGLVVVRQTEDLADAVFHSTVRAISGQTLSPTRSGLTACQTSTYGCPSTSTNPPPGPRATCSAIRLSLLPGTR